MEIEPIAFHSRSSKTAHKTHSTFSISETDSSNDEYDSNNSQEIIHNTFISFVEADPGSKANNTFHIYHKMRRHYWKVNFAFVLVPFICWGIPVHLLITGYNRSRKYETKRTKDWLKFIFFEDKPYWKISFLTLPFALAGLCFYGYFIYLFLKFLHQLLIKGELSDTFFRDLINIIRMIPVLVPLTVVWFWGYTIRNLLNCFDKLLCPAAIVGKDEKEMTRRWNRLPSARLFLLTIYRLILVYETVQVIFVIEKINLKSLEAITAEDLRAFTTETWISFLLSLSYNLMLPVYVSFALAIQFEYEWLTLHIKALIRQRVFPSCKHLDDIKQYFKTIASNVLVVNDVCNMYFSWVILVLITQLRDETRGTAASIINTILGSETLSEQKSVRLLAGYIFSILFQILVIFLTVWFAIGANDLARDVHVRLNDFVTQRDFVLSPELYRKYRMLKYYIHSRMETEKPTLLTLAVVSILPFGLYNWMISYNVRH